VVLAAAAVMDAQDGLADREDAGLDHLQGQRRLCVKRVKSR
jgi:hypothetical protein